MAWLGWVVAGVSRRVEGVASTVFGFLALVQIAGPCSPWKGDTGETEQDQTINSQEQLPLARRL